MMRTTGALRALKGLKAPLNKDSLYRKITRRNDEEHDLEVKVPKSLLKQLPFKDQKKQVVEVTGLTSTLDTLGKDAPLNKLTEALLTDHEKERINMITKLKAIDAARRAKQLKRENKLKIKKMREQVRLEREQKKRKREFMSKIYIKKAAKRLKKAKYTLEETTGKTGETSSK